MSNRWTIAYFIVVGSLPFLKKALTCPANGASGAPGRFSLTRAGKEPRRPRCPVLLASSSLRQPENPDWPSATVAGLCSESKSLTISGRRDGVCRFSDAPAGPCFLPDFPGIPDHICFQGAGSQGKHKGQRPTHVSGTGQPAFIFRAIGGCEVGKAAVRLSR